jgi:hypothetical protein
MNEPNQIQRAWNKASSQLRRAEDDLREAERSYLRIHKIKNPDGTLPKCFGDLDSDEPETSYIISEFWRLNGKLAELLEERRCAYKAAENALISWGIEQLRREGRNDHAAFIERENRTASREARERTATTFYYKTPAAS